MKTGTRLLAAVLLAGVLSPAVSVDVRLQEDRLLFMERQIACLAETIYFEARSESDVAQLSVGFVPINRKLQQGGTLCAVIAEPRQFSGCIGSCRIREPEAFEKAYLIARRLVYHHLRIRDPTGGAIYFHDDRVRPYWARSFDQTAQYASLRFYSGR